jgi:L-threonylcarbamoyladenylate synthase
MKSSLVLKQGGLVAFPTETVYGLGANALNETSVLSIFKAKGRPLTDPLIVHVASKNDIMRLFDFTNTNTNTNTDANTNNETNELALTICNILCDAFWPGPLTIIYKASKLIPSCVTAGTGRMIMINYILIILVINIIIQVLLVYEVLVMSSLMSY